MTDASTAPSLAGKCAAFDGALLRQRQRAAAVRCPERRDFSAFGRAILRGKGGHPLPDSCYSQILAASLVWCRENRMHLAHMGPPSLGKSTTMRAFLTWCLGNDPTLATVIISAEEKVAKRQVMLCRKMVLGRPFRAVFPEIEPDITRGERKTKGASVEDAQGWTMGQWFLRNAGQSTDPAMAADAADPKSEARRVDILFADDVISRRVAFSDAERKRMIEAFEMTWLDGRMSGGSGFCVVTHNCWHKADLIHKLLADHRFLHLWVSVADDCESLCVRLFNAPSEFPLVADPARFGAEPLIAAGGASHEFRVPLPTRRTASRFADREEIDESWSPAWLRLKRDNKPGVFRLLFRLQAIEPGEMMFPHFLARRIIGASAAAALGVREVAHLPSFQAIDRHRFRLAGGLDWSSRKRRGKALTLLARRGTDGVLVPAYHKRIDGGVQEVARLLDRLWACGLRWEILNVEDNATQDELNAALKILGGQLPFGPEWVHTVTAFTTGANKMDLSHGLPALDVEFETGGVVWVEESARDDSPHRLDWAALEEEFAEMPRAVEPGKTPDGPMSFWFAYRAARDRFHAASGGESFGVASPRSRAMEGF